MEALCFFKKVKFTDNENAIGTATAVNKTAKLHDYFRTYGIVRLFPYRKLYLDLHDEAKDSAENPDRNSFVCLNVNPVYKSLFGILCKR